MEVVDKAEVLNDIDYWVHKLKKIVFIHPTDTIYGIGCDATNPKLVARVRSLKQRDVQPFSVIAPSKAWIRENFKITKKAEEWLKKLPGPYTLILEKKKNPVAKNTAPGLNTLGVRIPKHWIRFIVKKMGVPIITTSANITGGNFMRCLEDLDEQIRAGVDVIIYDGCLKRKPSTIIRLDRVFKIIERHK